MAPNDGERRAFKVLSAIMCDGRLYAPGTDNDTVSVTKTQHAQLWAGGAIEGAWDGDAGRQEAGAGKTGATAPASKPGGRTRAERSAG